MSIGLSLITNDAIVARHIIHTYSQYFDKFFVTIADKNKKQLTDLQSITKDASIGHKVKLSYFKWEDHFGKAREFNRQQIDTDYWMWIDSDDVIENPEAIKGLVDQMKKGDLDALYALYKYQQNDLGEQTAPHWRERIIRTKSAFKWAQSRCHETLLAPAANTARCEDITILHVKDKAAEESSMLRNIKLLKLDFEETKDPRTAMYLGDNLMYLQEFDQALAYFTYLLQNGGWEEDKYRAWLRVAEIFYQRNQYAEALNACNAAEDVLPEFPDAYFLKASIYNAMDNDKKCLEWVKVGMSKPLPETLSVTDPTLYEYRGIFMGALSALSLGLIDDAFQMYQIVLKRSPNYQLALDMKPLFEEAYYDNKAINITKWLVAYLKENGGKPEQVLAALPFKLFSDPRMNYIRSTILPKKKWDKGSVVYYCGQAAETWGPDTLSKGMGGSEEAVVNLSRELAKLGHEVTVFNDREEEYVDTLNKNGSYKFRGNGKSLDGKVTYKPWTLLNPADEFDTFISWRAPENCKGVKARVKIVDLHDTIKPERVYAAAEDVDKFFVKSQYHRDLYPELPDDKFVIIGNGIVKEQFDAKEV